MSINNGFYSRLHKAVLTLLPYVTVIGVIGALIGILVAACAYILVLDQRLTELTKVISIGDAGDGRKQVTVNGVLYAQEYQAKGIRLWNDGRTAGLRIALDDPSRMIILEQQGKTLKMIGHQPIGPGHYQLHITDGEGKSFINFYDGENTKHSVLND